MVKPEIAGENLILHVEGMDKVWALKSQLTIPLKHISGVRVDEVLVKKWYQGVRLPGTSIPGVITAGTVIKKASACFGTSTTRRRPLCSLLLTKRTMS